MVFNRRLWQLKEQLLKIPDLITEKRFGEFGIQGKNNNDYWKYINVGTYEYVLHAMFPCCDIKDFILDMDVSVYLFSRNNISPITWHFYNSNAKMVKGGD